MLRRVVSTVKFLCSRGLAFRGDNQCIGSSSNGNFLGALEFLAEYDCLMNSHLSKYGNVGKGNVSYLSANICEEFIELMGEKVLNQIVQEIHKAKYYSVSIDSTPDKSRVDQLTFVVRYVKDSEPVERFLSFIAVHSHQAAYLANTVVAFLEKLKLSIEDCRGQSYDNASNMSGCYSGVQARLKTYSPTADYIPCAGHSLNLEGENAAKCCRLAVDFFGVLQSLFNFFSASTHRWEILTTSLGPKKKGVEKPLTNSMVRKS